MNQVIEASIELLGQLESICAALPAADFSRSSGALSGASVGQHVRHTIEFFVCLEEGFHSGVVNYDKRERNHAIESDKDIALLAIRSIRRFVSANTIDKEMTLEVSYDREGEQTVRMATNYFRELAYNVEHAVHHAAIIKIGLREITESIHLPEHFGVAVSTVRHHESVVRVS